MGQVVSSDDVDGMPTQADARALRAQAVDEMRRMRGEQGCALFGDEHRPDEIEEGYLARMERPGEWLNGAALGALGVRHQVKVFCCFREAGKVIGDRLCLMDCTLGTKSDLAVVLCWSGQHYEPLGRCDSDTRRYVYRFPADAVEQVVRTDARQCLDAWFQLKKGGHTIIEGITDASMLGKLDAKCRQLQIDFLVLREAQGITEQVVDNKIEQLERMIGGDEELNIRKVLKKSLSGRGSVAPIKRGGNGVWLCEDQSVLSLKEDGCDRHNSVERDVVESFRREHIWRRMLLCARMREKRPEWF